MKNNLTLRELQDEVKELYEKRNYTAGAPTLALGISEEAGEVSQAILITECKDFKPSAKKLSPEWADVRDVASEIGDLITYCLALCNKLDIVPYFKWMNK